MPPKKGHVEIVKLLLKKGMGVNSILVCASLNGHIEIVKLMLEKGANNYKEAIQWAEINNHTEIVKLLKEKQ